MEYSNPIYGNSLEYGEFSLNGTESYYKPAISKFRRIFSDRSNVFISESILNGYSIINYHWKITSVRGTWLDQSGNCLNSISYTWPNAGGRYTVELTISDSLNNESSYTYTYDISDVVISDTNQNSSASIPSIENTLFNKDKLIIKIEFISVVLYSVNRKITVLDINEINRVVVTSIVVK